MVRGIVIGVVGLILVVAAAAWIAISMGYAPANADARPSHLEGFIAMTALRAVISRQAPQGPNPEAPTDQNVIEGIHLYAQNCAVCHGGADGKPSNIAQGLYQKPPQFGRHRAPEKNALAAAHAATPHKPFPGGTYWKIAHGIRMTGMPSFGGTLTQDQIWKIALFLSQMRSLSPAAQRVWVTVKN